ncbi:DUF4915 domain-containing protein [Pseudodesulfovibrio sp. zrk46]|uniref:DUF4915 domain-containing protein n=1 Tax=Pseudodesulfovibrio sp. zrk46 TaxID=2725288 RepID=UPI001449BD54|nr:DUF4915 domain-containing protein [Pseudodesulfovibrio sp. zrk46]QJB58062.1 DUF4915 domain-containing protein [Pseudodesulfovibrio sp. zrk46]
MDIMFSSYADVYKNLGDREIVLFGAGNITKKTKLRLDRPLSMIVDNNANLWEEHELGVTIKKPEVINGKSDQYYVLICTTSFMEVSEQLMEYGFDPLKDFIVSPVLNDLRIISDIESLKTKLLFSSGLPGMDDPEAGGGIYELELDGDWKYRKVLEGPSHGLIHFEGDIIASHSELGLVQMSKDYKVIRNAEVPTGSRPHGVAYSEHTQCFYVASTYLDAILVFDRDFKQVDQINVSHKHAQTGEPQHHINDVCAYGESLYVSMFSMTGNWKKDVFDGVVLEIDLDTKQVLNPVVQNLWMPHNICAINGSLAVLDSLRGELKTHNAQPIGKFPGFSRGLAYDGVFHYIGQSRNRNYSKYLGLSMNISIDTSIIVFDATTKVSRSLSLPSKLSEIHSIIVL